MIKYEQLIRIDSGANIYVKLLSSTDSINKRCVLCISGGPGYGHASMEPWGQEIVKQLPDTTIILFDQLHCGKSSRSLNPDNDFTLDNFSEIACQVIEATVKEFQIQQMDLYIFGGSFGSMTAMLIPLKREQWITDTNSPIQLQGIISAAGPISWKAILQSKEFVQKQYANDPKCTQYLEAMDTLYAGKIQSKKDYIENVVLALAPVYADKFKNFSQSGAGYLLKNHPNWTTSAIGFFSPLSDSLRFMHEALTGCSLQVLNHFFREKFHGFDLQEIIENNPIYHQVKFLFITGQNDHIAFPELNSDLLMKQLPHANQIVLRAKHSISADNLTVPVVEIIAQSILNNRPQFIEKFSNEEWLNAHSIERFSTEFMDNSLEQHVQPNS